MGERSWRNPVWEGYLADPFVWRADGRYYATGTGAEGAGADASAALSTAGVFPLLRSDDFCRWDHLGQALERPDPALGGEFWAPAVAESAGRYNLYYSVGDAAIPRHVLRVAQCDSPAGPYRDRGALTDPQRTPFAIDPHPFQDDDGSWWLFYARDFLDREDGTQAGTALVVDRLVGMTRLAGEERVVLRARHPWTLFARDRAMYGRRWDWHTLEGPCVVKRHGRYWCFYSGACWGTPSYGVDYAVAARVDGPYSDAGAELGPRVLRSIAGLTIGPGHNSLVIGPDGDDFLAYHAWDETVAVRRMHLDRLRWTADGPRCTPTRTPQLLDARGSPR